MIRNVNAVLADDAGQGLVEYGLIIAFVALACIVGLQALAGKINGFLTAVGNDL